MNRISSFARCVCAFGLTLSAAPGIAGAPLPARASPASVVIADSTFASSDWFSAATGFTSGAGSGFTFGSVTVASGGNPGAYRSITHTLTAPTSGGVTGVTVYNTYAAVGGVFDPATSGPIQSLTYSEDRRPLNAEPADGRTFIYLIQDNVRYEYDLPPVPAAGWQSRSFPNLTAADFAGSGAPSQLPDFSAQGGPITFGFGHSYSRNFGAFESGHDYAVDIDNWRWEIFTGTVVAQGPDLWVSLSIDPPSGSELTSGKFARVFYGNRGTTVATNVTVRAHLPTYLPPPGWQGDGSGMQTTVAQLAPGQVITAETTYEGDYTNDSFIVSVASISDDGANGADVDPLNNAVTRYTPVACDEIVCCALRLLDGVMPSIQLASVSSADAVDSGAFYALRETVMRLTPQGQHYITVYETHQAEVKALMQADAALKSQAQALVLAWQPVVLDTVFTGGRLTTVTISQTTALDAFLDELDARGSPGLKAMLQTERAAVSVTGLAGQSAAQMRTLTLGEPRRVFLPTVYAAR